MTHPRQVSWVAVASGITVATGGAVRGLRHCAGVTLTGQLDRPVSPIGIWVRSRLPHGAALLKQLRQQAGGSEAVVPGAARPYPVGFEPGRQALAHELRLRVSLGELDLAFYAAMARRLPAPHAEAAGAVVTLTGRLLAALSPWDRNLPWLRPTEQEESLARCLWVFAQLEVAYRRGIHDPAGPLMAGGGPDALLERAGPDSVADLRALAEAAARGPFAALRDMAATAVVIGPTPSAAHLVDGADGDFLVSRLLVEVKSVGQLGRIRREDLWQLLLYALLDTDDVWQVDTLGLYLGRHAALVRWSLEQYVTVLSGQPADLPGLRADLHQHLLAASGGGGTAATRTTHLAAPMPVNTGDCTA